MSITLRVAEAFHGTYSIFTLIDPDKSGLGAHFGTYQASSDRLNSKHLRAKSDTAKGQIILYHLDITKPLKLQDAGKWDNLQWLKEIVRADLDIPYADREFKNLGDFNQLRAYIEALGFDSVVYKNEEEDRGSWSYIVWRPELIKELSRTKVTELVDKNDTSGETTFGKDHVRNSLDPGKLKSASSSITLSTHTAGLVKIPTGLFNEKIDAAQRTLINGGSGTEEQYKTVKNLIDASGIWDNPYKKKASVKLAVRASAPQPKSMIITAFSRIAGPERIKVLKTKYPLYTQTIDEFAEKDPTGGHQKYLEWMIRDYMKESQQNDEAVVQIFQTVTAFNSIVKYLGTDKYSPELKNVSKDINSYKTLESLKNAVETAKEAVRGHLTIEEMYQKWGKNYDYAIREFARADPTGKQKYLDWALEQLKAAAQLDHNSTPVALGQDWTKQEIHRITNAYGLYNHLTKNEKLQQGMDEEIPDINEFKSVDDLEEYAKGLNELSGAEAPDVIYEDDDYTAYGPITNKAQLCSVGSKEWCVARWSDSFFESDTYMGNEKGDPHFIMIQSKKNTDLMWLAFIRNEGIQEIRDESDETVDPKEFTAIFDSLNISLDERKVTIYYITTGGRRGDVEHVAEDAAMLDESVDNSLRSSGYEIYKGEVPLSEWDTASETGDYQYLSPENVELIETVEPQFDEIYTVVLGSATAFDQHSVVQSGDHHSVERWLKQQAEPLKLLDWQLWKLMLTPSEAQEKPSNWDVEQAVENSGEEPELLAHGTAGNEANNKVVVYFSIHTKGNYGPTIEAWSTKIEDVTGHQSAAEFGDVEIYHRTLTAGDVATMQVKPSEKNVWLNPKDAKKVSDVPVKMSTVYVITDNGDVISNIFKDQQKAVKQFSDMQITGKRPKLQLLKVEMPIRMITNSHLLNEDLSKLRPVVVQQNQPTDDQQALALPHSQKKVENWNDKQHREINEQKLNKKYLVKQREQLVNSPVGTTVKVTPVFGSNIQQFVRTEVGRWRNLVSGHEDINLPSGKIELVDTSEQLGLPLKFSYLATLAFGGSLSTRTAGFTMSALKLPKDFSVTRDGYKTYTGTWKDHAIKIRYDLQVVPGSHPHGKRQKREGLWNIFVDNEKVGSERTIYEAKQSAYKFVKERDVDVFIDKTDESSATDAVPSIQPVVPAAPAQPAVPTESEPMFDLEPWDTMDFSTVGKAASQLETTSGVVIRIKDVKPGDKIRFKDDYTDKESGATVKSDAQGTVVATDPTQPVLMIESLTMSTGKKKSRVSEPKVLPVAPKEVVLLR